MIQIKLIVLLGLLLAMFARVSVASDLKPVQDFDLCKDSTFDTMFDTPDGKVYIFKKDKYYELDGANIADGPKPISDKWKGLPESIDGAFTQNGKTFFFKNGKYWRFTNYEMDPNYPLRLHLMYSTIPKNIDDATVIDGKVYFFAGSKVFRMDEFNEKNTFVTEQNLSKHWKGIPNRLDAVHYAKNWDLTFFFKVDNFYAFEPNREAYAIPTNSYFFGCRTHK